jgi:hypothetical protein
LRRGKPSAGAKHVRAQVENAVFLVLRAHSATREALAEALGTNVRTIDRLRDAGALDAAA